MRSRARPLPTWRLAAAVGVSVLLLAVGCSDDGAAAPAGTSTTEAEPGDAPPTTEPTSEPASEPAEEVRASAGCGSEPDVEPIGTDRPGDVEQPFTAGELERTYRMGVPGDYDPEVPVPLVLNLHGSGSDALQASAYGDVPRAATERGMITVTPDAIDGRWELGNGPDTEFLAALLDDVEARYCIDLDRVHGLGMSLGAWKAAAVACALEGRFASLALVTVEVFPGECEPMAVVAFHGTADTVAAYGEGGGTVAPGDVTANAGITGTRENVAQWAENAGCDPDPTEEPVGDDVRWLRYEGCDEGIGVDLYTIVGGGHTWPGTDIVLGPPGQTTSTIDATELALDWFEAHPRP